MDQKGNIGRLFLGSNGSYFWHPPPSWIRSRSSIDNVKLQHQRCDWAGEDVLALRWRNYPIRARLTIEVSGSLLENSATSSMAV